MFSTSKLDSLRKSHFALTNLPSVVFVAASDRLAKTSRPIEHASIDEVALAIVRAERAFSAAGDHLIALRKLHDLAREAGGIGSARAVDAAAKAKSRR
jgi:hypothetical protein